MEEAADIIEGAIIMLDRMCAEGRTPELCALRAALQKALEALDAES